MSANTAVAQIGAKADPSGKGERFVFGTIEGKVWIANTRSGDKYCAHEHDYADLVAYLQSNAGEKNICPSCASLGHPVPVLDLTEEDDVFWKQPTMTIWSLLNSNSSLTELRNLISRAGLVDALNTPGPFTVFAPNNNAIRSLTEDLTGQDLVDVLKHHVVPGRILYKDVDFGITEVKTLAGTTLFVRREAATIFVDSVKEGKGDYARVCAADTLATNGVIHVIDHVLVPPSASTRISAKVSNVEAPLYLECGLGESALPWYGSIAEAIAWTPRLSTLTQKLRFADLYETLNTVGGKTYTLFAPTDEAFASLGDVSLDTETLRRILTHHVVAGNVMSSAVPRDGIAELTTLAGDIIRVRRSENGIDIKVDNATVIAEDFTTANGVIHVIDEVLMPSMPSFASASASSNTASSIGQHMMIRTRSAPFKAFNIKPDTFATHRSESAVEHVPLVQYEKRYKWTSSVGEGYVLPFDVQKEAYGKSIDSLMPQARKTSEFEIAYTVMLPRSWDTPTTRGDNDNKTVVLMVHGVPANRKWKYHMMEIMAKRGVIVVACDLLGMGESSQVLDYRRFKQSSKEEDVNSAWDWKYDVEWMQSFIKDAILDSERLGFRNKQRIVVAADDWGSGPAEWLLSSSKYSGMVEHLMLINPIHLDGYFVIEIGTIGRADAARRKFGNTAFEQETSSLPQVILGIEKYMIQDRKRMNRYTESSNMFPYQDTDYQSGETAAEMKPNYWNMAVLAARASRLAPRQLQPYDKTENPEGLPYDDMPDVPVDIIWGIEDQMMPPIQVWRSVYAFPGPVQSHLIAEANHFSEIDQPYRIADAMTSALLRQNKTAIPVFLGDNPEFVYKGDEKEMRKSLQQVYVRAPRT